MFSKTNLYTEENTGKMYKNILGRISTYLYTEKNHKLYKSTHIDGDWFNVDLWHMWNHLLSTYRISGH